MCRKFKEKIQVVQTRTRDLIRQGVPKDQYLSKTIFARNAAPGFYDELAKVR